MKNYIAIIGDLEGSKELSRADRKKTQATLDELFLKEEFANQGVISPYTITLGDEFQALYVQPDYLFYHIWMISAAVHPVLIRWSAGIGEIDTPINKKQSLGMDGPAFHKSREGIELLKKQKELFRIDTGQELFDSLANSSLKLLSANLRTWNRNRFLILEKLCRGEDVKDIAADLKLSDVAVYKNINAGRLEAIMEYTSGIAALLKKNSG